LGTLSNSATQTIGLVAYTENTASSTITTGFSLQIIRAPVAGTNVL